MKSVYLLMFVCCLMLSCASDNTAQTPQENKALFASKSLNDENLLDAKMALIKLGSNSKAPTPDKSRARRYILDYSTVRKGQPYLPQNFEEAYWTLIKGDQSLAQAGQNTFELNKARAAFQQKSAQAQDAIQNFDDSQLIFYNEKLLGSDGYDFNTNTFSFELPSISLSNASWGGMIIHLKTDAQTSEKPLVKLEISQDKISPYFGQRSSFQAMLKITYGDLFENREGAGSEVSPCAIIKSVDVFDLATGDYLGTCRF